MDHAAKSEKRSAAVIIGAIVILLGMALSIYSLFHHYQVRAHGQTDAFCNISETLNCDAVANSKYSEIFGIPLGAWGLGYFLACAYLFFGAFSSYKTHFLTLGIVQRVKSETFADGMLLFAWIGVLTSIALGAISHFEVHALCPTCLAIYACTLVLLVCTLALKKGIVPTNWSAAIEACMYSAIPVAVIVGSVLVVSLVKKPGEDKVMKPKSDPNVVHQISVSTSPYQGAGEDYRKGNDIAKVTVIEFADFECPACGQLAEALKDVHKQFGDSVRIVFKNFPLNKECNPAVGFAGHKHACKVAILARCAGQYGKFWDYHDRAFAKQREISETASEKWAQEVGLTSDQIKGCLSSKDHLDKIADDSKEGDKAGVDGTPSVYINGYKYEGRRDAESIGRAIERFF